ncbi:MAG: HIT family protein [Kiritimatiellae bacterium]|nr:HIT family protein [Kiritimatiellia bacterium]
MSPTPSQPQRPPAPPELATDCVFCRIVRGEIPSVKLYEDSEVLAFMDISPIVKGHALVIPKAHYDPLTALPAALLGRVMSAVQRIAAAQTTALQADGVNIFQANGAAAGQVVPHVHFHVIPRFNNDGHRWNWTSGRYERTEDMDALAGRIRARIAG